jgi:hypothetical protein
VRNHRRLSSEPAYASRKMWWDTKSRRTPSAVPKPGKYRFTRSSILVRNSTGFVPRDTAYSMPFNTTRGPGMGKEVRVGGGVEGEWVVG